VIRHAGFLAAAIAAVFISGCEKGNVDGYTWYRASDPARRYWWYVVSPDELDVLCGTRAHACSVVQPLDDCYVYSTFTEAEARKYTPSGPLGKTTLFEHEVWNNDKTLGHCAGFDHKERDIRRV
jgi:hypothetical protein